MYQNVKFVLNLKEAQEKTDEITAKFLDKEKDPLNYRPQPIVTASSESAAATASNASTAATALKCDQCNKTFKKKSNLLFHVERVHQTSAPSKSGGRGRSSQQQQQVSF